LCNGNGILTDSESKVASSIISSQLASQTKPSQQQQQQQQQHSCNATWNVARAKNHSSQNVFLALMAEHLRS